ncbi:MAG: hypothetical protein ACMUHM_09105 [Thermoplasmatota archaeon]
MGEIRKKLGKISPFLRWGSLFAIITAILFYTTNRVFILGWSLFTRSLFKIMTFLTIYSMLLAFLLLAAWFIDSTKLINHRLERDSREIISFQKQFRTDQNDRKQVWGANILFKIAPVLFITLMVLLVSFTEICRLEFIIILFNSVLGLGIYLLYYDSFKKFKDSIRYVQCRKCRTYNIAKFEGEPIVIKCNECDYPELLEFRFEMEKRGFIKTKCSVCKRNIFTRRKKNMKLRCPYCRRIIRLKKREGKKDPPKNPAK